MHARITSLILGPGTRQTAESMADELGAYYKTLPGLKSVTFFGDYDAGEYGSFQVWETKEAADSAMPAIRKILEEKTAGLLKGPPKRLSYDIYEPKG